MRTLEQFKAGHTERYSGYQCFVPETLRGAWSYSTPSLHALLERAAVKLGELNSYAQLVPNIDLFIQLHVTKEAVVSSKIEGTQTNLKEALTPEKDIEPERRQDWQEVHNYIRAMNEALVEMKSLPLSSRLLRQTHRRLLGGVVRGGDKMPGEFRRTQNWIGGNSLADATFIPCLHQDVDRLMSDLEYFLHDDTTGLPAIIRAGLAHYQFETIHPFLDGNGRIGRLLITLYMIEVGLLTKPLLYLSSYFEADKNLYYDNLTRVRTHNDIVQWLKYFLVGVAQTAEQACYTLGTVIAFKLETEHTIREKLGRRAPKAMHLLDHLFREPVMSVNQVQQYCEVSYKTANELVAALVEHSVLVEFTGQSRHRTFSFDGYLAKYKI